MGTKVVECIDPINVCRTKVGHCDLDRLPLLQHNYILRNPDLKVPLNDIYTDLDHAMIEAMWRRIL